MDRHTERFRDSYWTAFDGDAHARHADFLRGAGTGDGILAVDAVPDPFRAITSFTVYTADQPGLFAKIAGAMAVSGWQLWFARQAYYSDADTINQPAETAVVRDILWQPPQRLDELINTLEDDYEPRPSTDCQLL